jgi:hypothetical protein
MVTKENQRFLLVYKVTNDIVISNTRGYEIAGKFRPHYTSICFDDNIV